jgi:hypothetical protein
MNVWSLPAEGGAGRPGEISVVIYLAHNEA